MHIGSWIKEHPTESVVLGGIVFVSIYLLMKHGGGSSASSYYAAQAGVANQQASLAATEAQQQAQTEQANIAASVANNQTLASLAAVKTQYDSAVQAAKIKAGVIDNQTAAAESVTNARTAAQASTAKSYIDAETTALQSELAAENQSQSNYENFVVQESPNVTTFNGSQNRLAFFQSLFGQPQAAAATEGSYAAINNPQYGYGMQVGNILTGIGNVLKGWFS